MPFLHYYEETMLEGSTNVNRVYGLRNKIRHFVLYDFDEVEEFNKFMAINMMSPWASCPVCFILPSPDITQ